MNQPEPQPKKYDQLFADIDAGRIKIPQFQRDFVWSRKQSGGLLDSILKGYPIGTFILWKTKERLPHIRDIGNTKLPEPPAGDFVQYVLDGQQRITSLYAIRKGVVATKEGEEICYSDIWIDLSQAPESDDDLVVLEQKEGKRYVSLHDLLTKSIAYFAKNFRDDEIDRIDQYKRRLETYDFSTILLSEASIDTAVEVFTRINVSGTELSLFEIMVAKTYDPKKKFDLAEEYKKLIEGNGNGEKGLQHAGFEDVSEATVLQCMSVHLCQQARRKDILVLDRKNFIAAWDTVKSGLFSAVDYVSTSLSVPVSRLLPYNALLVPLTYFFIRTKGKPPTPVQDKLLKQYFWWASLSNRFSSSTESKLAADVKRMDAILKGKSPSYQGEEITLSIDSLKWKWFGTGDAFCRAILCLYASHGPKSFESNQSIKLDNSWLKIITSKNYHHFFPRSHLKQQGFEDWQANSIINITLVDDYLNKQKIGSKPPKVYMKDFKKTNKHLTATMRTHMIGDLDEFGVWKDDYEAFLDKRAEWVLNELNERLLVGTD